QGVGRLRRLFFVNNFLAKNGWLKFSMDPSGRATINWDESKAVFIRSGNIFVNPRGLGGPRIRAQEPEYESLRNQIISALNSVADESERPYFQKAMKSRQAQAAFK